MKIKDFKDDCDYSRFDIIFVKINQYNKTIVEMQCQDNPYYTIEGRVEKDSPIMSGTYLIDVELHFKENSINYFYKGKKVG